MKQRDGEATRMAILDAAARLFAAGGYAGVSVDQIAKAAGIQRSLLLYHFGSKAKLWAAVAEARLGPYLERLAQEVDGAPDDGFLARLATAHFHFLRENPEIVRLVMWHKLEAVFEEIEPGTGPNPAGAVLLGRFEQRLARLQLDGRIRDDVQPAHLVTVLLGLVEFWFHSKSFDAALKGSAAADEAYLADALRVIERGLRPA